MKCTAIAGLLSANWSGQPCATLSLRPAIRAQQPIDLTENQMFRWHRGGVVLGIQRQKVASRVWFGPKQLQLESGPLITPQLLFADIRYRASKNVFIGGGVMEDVWGETGNQVWGLRQVEAAAGELHKLAARSHLGGMAVASLLDRKLSIAAHVHTGESSKIRESSVDKNTAVRIQVKPLQKPALLSLELFAQSQLWTENESPDQRLGVRVSSKGRAGRIGASGLWRSAAEDEQLYSGWGRLNITKKWEAYTRWDGHQVADNLGQTLLTGGGYRLDRRAWAWLGWKATQALEKSAESTAFGALEHSLFMQISGRFDASFAVPESK